MRSLDDSNGTVYTYPLPDDKPSKEKPAKGKGKFRLGEQNHQVQEQFSFRAWKVVVPFTLVVAFVAAFTYYQRSKRYQYEQLV